MNHRLLLSRRPLAAALAIGLSSTAQAALVTLGTGQAVALPNPAGDGKVLTVRHVSGKGQLRYQSTVSYENGYVSSLDGFMSFLNVSVLAIGGGTTGTVQELFDETADGEVLRTQARVTSPGTSATVDTADGAIKAMGGFTAGSVSSTRAISGWLTGGTFTASNLRISLADRTVTADLQGQRHARGTTPAVAYNQLNVPLWTFDSVSGPRAIPVQALLSGADPQTALRNAGFSIWSVAPDRITFNGVFTLKGARLTAAGRTWWTQTLGLISVGLNAFNNANSLPEGTADLAVGVMFSVPVPAR